MSGTWGPGRRVAKGPEAGDLIEATVADDEAPEAPEEVVMVEREIALDMVRRGVYVAPVILAAAGIGGGWGGVASAAYGLALVLANFLIAAGLLGWAAKKGPSLLMAAAFGGFVLRMGLLVLAVQLVKDQAWLEPLPLGITILAAYLGLLFWETRFVSASLAFPGLKPHAGPKSRSKGA